MRQGESALQNIAEMAKVSHNELRLELKNFTSVSDEIISTARKNRRDRSSAEYEDGLELGAECREVYV